MCHYFLSAFVAKNFYAFYVVDRATYFFSFWLKFLKFK